jgi:hypothetical protein
MCSAFRYSGPGKLLHLLISARSKADFINDLFMDPQKLFQPAGYTFIMEFHALVDSPDFR